MDGSPDTRSLLTLALDQAAEALRNSDGPLDPFVVVDAQDERQLHRFPGESLEESLAGATRYVTSECRGMRAVLVYDGYLTQGDARSEAIYAEVVDELGNVTVVAQRYRPHSRLRRFDLVRNPVQLAIKGRL